MVQSSVHICFNSERDLGLIFNLATYSSMIRRFAFWGVAKATIEPRPRFVSNEFRVRIRKNTCETLRCNRITISFDKKTMQM
jgi:hypothetical protein